MHCFASLQVAHPPRSNGSSRFSQKHQSRLGHFVTHVKSTLVGFTYSFDCFLSTVFLSTDWLKFWFRETRSKCSLILFMVGLKWKRVANEGSWSRFTHKFKKNSRVTCTLKNISHIINLKGAILNLSPCERDSRVTYTPGAKSRPTLGHEFTSHAWFYLSLNLNHASRLNSFSPSPWGQSS